jgi:hypothetical protein
MPSGIRETNGLTRPELSRADQDQAHEIARLEHLLGPAVARDRPRLAVDEQDPGRQPVERQLGDLAFPPQHRDPPVQLQRALQVRDDQRQTRALVRPNASARVGRIRVR